MSRAIVFGGYGTFGRIVTGELRARGIEARVAGRDRERAEVVCDLTDRAQVEGALAGVDVAVSCAGPFSAQGMALLDGCLKVGCHYVDIADDRGFAAAVRGRDGEFRERSLTAAYGCSSLPGLSGALGLEMVKGGWKAERARVTLFIGNDNPKGGAAIRSVVGLMGRTIEAPQGGLRGMGDRVKIELPEPFGRRAGVNFESPEYDLFPGLLGVKEVVVKVAFEVGAATAVFAMLARVGSGYGRGTAAFLDRVGGVVGGRGSSGGVVMVELWDAAGEVRRGAVVAREKGQRMAAMPCVLAVERVCKGGAVRGVVTAYELLGEGLLEEMRREGCEVTV